MSKILVAEIETKIIGFSAFGRDGSTEGTDFVLRAIYLSPNYWDKCIGSALWLASLETMLSQGAKSIWLWVLSDNERAIKFYLKAGFHEDPSSLKLIELGGIQRFEVRYVLHVDDASLFKSPPAQKCPREECLTKDVSVM